MVLFILFTSFSWQTHFLTRLVLWSFNLKFIVCPNDWITFQQNKDDFKILNELKLDRRTCCLSPNGLEDVCGRRNCTLPCTNPNPFIPELKKDPAESHFSRDRDRAFFYWDVRQRWFKFSAGLRGGIAWKSGATSTILLQWTPSTHGYQVLVRTRRPSKRNIVSPSRMTWNKLLILIWLYLLYLFSLLPGTLHDVRLAPIVQMDCFISSSSWIIESSTFPLSDKAPTAFMRKRDPANPRRLTALNGLERAQSSSQMTIFTYNVMKLNENG